MEVKDDARVSLLITFISLYSSCNNKELRWNSKSQLMERDAAELPGIVIFMSGATRAMQRAMNLQ